jgi:hypothetical protein
MFSHQVTRSLAAGVAAIALGLGALGVVSTTSGSSRPGAANAASGFPHHAFVSSSFPASGAIG